jgi:hypothetical protein
MNPSRYGCAGVALFVAVVLAVVALSSGVASASSTKNGPGLCAQGQWQYLYTSGGEGFADHSSCVSYASGGGTLAGIVAFGTHFPAHACFFNALNDCWAEYVGFGLMPGTLTLVYSRMDSEPYFLSDEGLVASDGTVTQGPMFGCGFGLTSFYVTGVLANGTSITSNIATAPC